MTDEADEMGISEHDMLLRMREDALKIIHVAEIINMNRGVLAGIAQELSAVEMPERAAFRLVAIMHQMLVAFVGEISEAVEQVEKGESTAEINVIRIPKDTQH